MTFRAARMVLCGLAGAVLPATGAAAAERFVGIDISGRLVTVLPVR